MTTKPKTPDAMKHKKIADGSPVVCQYGFEPGNPLYVTGVTKFSWVEDGVRFYAVTTQNGIHSTFDEHEISSESKITIAQPASYSARRVK